MAKKSKRAAQGLDLGMAAFAGAAAGFVIFAMPQGSFDNAVALSGLPLLLPAAEPPLGNTARLAAVAAAAIAAFAFVFLLLRALSKPAPQPKRRSTPPVEIEVPVPRLRRADAHPDAPARRPIFAGLELGTPMMTPAEPEEDEIEEEEQEEQEEAFEPAEEPVAEEPAVEQPADEPAAEEVAEEERPLPSFIVPQAEVEPVEEPQAAPAEPDSLNEITERLPELPEVGQTSIPHLMQRLELGLVRRHRADPNIAQQAEPAQDNVPEPELDQRLRSAINDLQRLAARGG